MAKRILRPSRFPAQLVHIPLALAISILVSSLIAILFVVVVRFASDDRATALTSGAICTPSRQLTQPRTWVLSVGKRVASIDNRGRIVVRKKRSSDLIIRI